MTDDITLASKVIFLIFFILFVLFVSGIAVAIAIAVSEEDKSNVAPRWIGKYWDGM